MSSLHGQFKIYWKRCPQHNQKFPELLVAHCVSLLADSRMAEFCLELREPAQQKEKSKQTRQNIVNSNWIKGKTFPQWCGLSPEPAAQESCVIYSLWDTQNSTQQFPEQLDPSSKTALPSAEKWTKKSPNVPSNLNYSIWLCNSTCCPKDNTECLCYSQKMFTWYVNKDLNLLKGYQTLWSPPVLLQLYCNIAPIFSLGFTTTTHLLCRISIIYVPSIEFVPEIICSQAKFFTFVPTVVLNLFLILIQRDHLTVI